MKKYLRCFNNDGLDGLTVGKRYEIVDVDTREGDECYVIIDDAKARDHWPIEPDYEGICYLDRFTLEIDEEPRNIDGRKAEVTEPGRWYDAYDTFAEKYGYPDAAHNYQSEGLDTRKRLQEGDVVTLLVSAPHIERPDEGTLWIVEAANGERHIFNEKGLRILSDELNGITVLKDESLGGIEREYREVKRKARVGERIKIVAEEMTGENRKGEIYTVTKVANYSRFVNTDGKWDDGSTLNPAHEEYVVLEPSDIVRIDNERLRMVDRKAAAGERVIVVDAKASGGTYRNGDILTVKHAGPGGIEIDTEGRDMVWFLLRIEYRVLEPVETAKSANEAPALSAQSPLDQAAANICSLQSQVTSLQAQVQSLESRVAALEKASVASGPVDDVPPTFIAPPKTPQQIRDEKGCKPLDRDTVVERAKADIEGLQETDGLGRTAYRVKHGFVTYLCNVEFIVNRGKRTVVALLRWRYDGKTVKARGIAKAAPNDVFNAAIGRAIALRRALGLEIPAEYLNVPNPEEPRVGDVVYTACSFGNMTVAEKTDIRMRTISADAYAMLSEDKKYGKPRIIDDSREEVGA